MRGDEKTTEIYYLEGRLVGWLVGTEEGCFDGWDDGRMMG